MSAEEPLRVPLKGLHASPFSTALTLYIIVRFLNRYFISFFIREFHELVMKNASFCNYLIKSYSINFLSFIDFIRVFEKPSSSNGWRIVDDYNSIYYIIVWRRSIFSNSVVTSIESENFVNFSEKSSRTILLYIYNIFLNGRFFLWWMSHLENECEVVSTGGASFPIQIRK